MKLEDIEKAEIIVIKRFMIAWIIWQISVLIPYIGFYIKDSWRYVSIVFLGIQVIILPIWIFCLMRLIRLYRRIKYDNYLKEIFSDEFRNEIKLIASWSSFRITLYTLIVFIVLGGIISFIKIYLKISIDIPIQVPSHIILIISVTAYLYKVIQKLER